MTGYNLEHLGDVTFNSLDTRFGFLHFQGTSVPARTMVEIG